MKLSIHLEAIQEEEALKLSQGHVSERIQSIARNALLKARSEHRINAKLAFLPIMDTEGAYNVMYDGAVWGTARMYGSGKYWQVYVRGKHHSIRRTTWPLLQQAIREEISDNV